MACAATPVDEVRALRIVSSYLRVGVVGSATGTQVTVGGAAATFAGMMVSLVEDEN